MLKNDYGHISTLYGVEIALQGKRRIFPNTKTVFLVKIGLPCAEKIRCDGNKWVSFLESARDKLV